jgi:hypothetical protein
MTRCTKHDRGGNGCTKEVGHRGRCRIRRLDAMAAQGPADSTAQPAANGMRPPDSAAPLTADETIARTCEIATALGLRRTDLLDLRMGKGRLLRLFSNPSGGLLTVLDDDGEFAKARLELGPFSKPERIEDALKRLSVEAIRIAADEMLFVGGASGNHVIIRNDGTMWHAKIDKGEAMQLGNGNGDEQ